MSRQAVLSLILVVAGLAVGAGGYTALVKLRKTHTTQTPERPPLTVTAVQLEPMTVVTPVDGFGTTRADRLAVIGAQVAGQIVTLAETLRDGAAVSEGELLVRIDAREYLAQLARARGQLAADEAALKRLDVEERNLERLLETTTAEFDVAQREFDRIRALLEDGTSSLRELDAARVVLQRARRALVEIERQLAVLPSTRAQQAAICGLRRAEVTLAELSVERCEIVAPFAGRVERVVVEAGEQVVPGQQLFTLLDPRLIEIPVELPVSERPRVRAGAPVRLWLESQPSVTWRGFVARVAPSADPATRTFSLFVEVTQSEAAGPLMPGMFVRAQIEGPTLADVFLVPRSSIRESRVFVCVDQQASERAVDIRQHVRDQTVVSGLKPGDIVITSNLDALYNGAPVNPVLTETDVVAPSAGSLAPFGRSSIVGPLESTAVRAP